MSSNDDDPGSKLDTLTLRGDDGRPILMIGLRATLYFEQGWTRPVRKAVSQVAQDYIDQFRDQLRWAENPSSGHMHAMARVKRPAEWLPQHEDGAEWEFGFHGGDTMYEASAFQIEAAEFGEGDPRTIRPGYLALTLPLNYFAERGSTLAEYLLPICRRLKPLSGIAGIGILESLDGLSAGKHFPLVRELGERHPGLEIHSGVTRNHVGTGIKGVNWLTILGERWIQEMGGLEYLRVRLDEPTFPFYPYAGGVIIQAGPRPQIGDASKDLWPKDYITLHKVLKKIQIKDHYPLHFRLGGTTGEMDWDASRAWIFRFDGK